MPESTSANINKDLILREKLAIERTRMANDRTLLSFVRTSLYFSVAAFTLHAMVQIKNGWIIELALWMLAGLILITGLMKFYKSAKLIRESRKHIGNFLLEHDL